MEPTIYEINSIEYEHLELTWGQDKEILAMVSKISGKVDGKETIGFNAKSLQKLLLKYDIMGDFWGLVLTPRKNWRYWARQALKIVKPWQWRRGYWRWIDLSPVPNTMLEDMFEDFFLLNKKLLTRLSGLSNVLGLIAQTALKMEEKKPKASSTSSTPKPPPPSAPKSDGS